MILTCELCQSQFLTESDPHVIIPGLETKIYCYCKVKGDGDQRWIDQLRHEHKLYQKHLSGLKAENERLESENTKLRQCIEWYADRKNCDNADFSHVEIDDSGEEIADGGYRAREALKELEK